MKKVVRIFFLIFGICLLIGSTPDFIPKAHASFEMNTSEACIQFIKDFEGFSPKPYYDYSQHTVGYGTKCPTEKYFDYMADGISREEAEWLLREEITSVEADIHEKLIVPYNLIFTQNQFDALVSFSFNIGTGWMTYDSTLRNALLRNAGEDELVYAFSLYSTAGGNYLSGLITRRLCEANMFLNGVYSKTANDSYGYVLYEPNGGTLTYRVQGYVCGHNPLPVADAVRAGDVFLGWYTDLTGGTKVTELSRTLSGKTLFARWKSSETPENEDSYAMMIRVTGDVVNIRKGPGTNYGISKQVRRNDTLLLSHVTQLTNMKWGKVQDGWICLDYTNYDDLINGSDSSKEETTVPPSDDSTDSDNYPVTPDAVTGTVRVNDLLRIRSGPGTTYSTVGHLANGQKVEILAQKTAGSMVWGQITRGWVSMDYIIINDSTSGSDSNNDQTTVPEKDTTDSVGKTESVSLEGKITADVLRIRSGPGTDNPIVGFYYENETVVITEKLLTDSDYWGKTARGWISMNYVSVNSSDAESSHPADSREMTVIADCLRIRKTAGTDSKITAFLYYGEKVTGLETTDVNGTVWGRVAKGWICMDYVR